MKPLLLWKEGGTWRFEINVGAAVFVVVVLIASGAALA